jgi:two-component system, cell cycle sensor histidine kinase and response regulator CckA
MPKNTTIPRPHASKLRQQAEKALSNKQQGKSPRGGAIDARALVHELEVHQIELEIQNEELCRAQHETELSRTKLSNLYDFAPVGYLTLTEKDTISDLNLTAAGLLDTEKGIALNKPFGLFVSPESQDIVYLHRQEVLRTGTKQTCEFALKRKDGIPMDARLESIAMDMDGQRMILSVLTDITERKRQQKATTEAYEVLERQARERDKIEERLRQTQKLEALGTLAGGIAHDFNNILAGIIGFAELLQEDIPPDGPGLRHAELILKGANRGRDLVKRLLAFTRPSEHEKQPAVLQKIIEEALKLLQPLIPSTITIQKQISTAAVILADPVQMHQVVMNLCTNAAHAMQAKGGVLKVLLENTNFVDRASAPYQDMQPGEYVKLEVQDTGIGMDAEILERIFDPFFSTKGHATSTGLGLSVVSGIVKYHDGYIKVDSKPGAGSTFSVYFPKTGKRASSDVEARNTPQGHERILFVDDEEMLVELNRARLRGLGYKVVATTRSLKALEVFKARPDRFDLVITDYTMPAITGIDLARELLKIRGDIPIILCTGYTEAISADRVKEHGFKELLMKPMTKTDLAETVRRVLDKKTQT